MTGLDAYGAVTPPTFSKRSSVSLGSRTTGYICRSPKAQGPVYVSERDTDDHRYHGEDRWYDFPFDGHGYGLSMELFARLDGAGVGAVYIIETDTGDVLHYGFRQFVDGTPINVEDEADGRGYEKDPQKVVPVSDAVEVYKDAYPGVYTTAGGFQ